MKPLRSKATNRTGATAVEFALMVPIIFTLFMGGIEITRLNFIRQSVSNAAYEGARKAVMPGGTVSDAQTEAQRLLTILRISNGATYTATIDTDKVTMRVVVPVSQNSWGITRFCSGMNVSQTVTLSRESFSST